MMSGFSALDHVPDPIVVLDKEDNIIFLNQPALTLQQVVQKPMAKGDNFLNLVNPSQKQFILPLFAQLKSDYQERTLESEYTDAQGRHYVFEVLYKPVLNVSKNHELTYVIIREITREKILQGKQFRQAQDFSVLIEQANAVIFSIDSLQYITDWNNESTRVTGYTRSEVLAKQVGQFIAYPSIEKFSKFLEEIFLKKTMDSLQVQFNSPDKPLVIVLLNATPKINSLGVVVGVIFIGHDITELFSYRESLEQIVKERTLKLQTSLEKEKHFVEIRNKFVFMASHEFRTPLSNISSSARYVSEQVPLDQVAQEKLRNIENQVSHMRVLIDDVLAIGKAESAQLKVNTEKFNLTSFLARLVEEVKVSVNHSHEVRMDLPYGLVEITSDQKLLRNIFINLLSNAMKFSPGQPHVTLGMTINDDVVTITVSDQGIGIAEEDLFKVFEPFNRGANATSIKGTGLGLSIVKRAVDTVGGKLTISSKLTEGTTVAVSLNL